jgi:glycosyltransferase involved in cell wall biosynthesis
LDGGAYHDGGIRKRPDKPSQPFLVLDRASSVAAARMVDRLLVAGIIYCSDGNQIFASCFTRSVVLFGHMTASSHGPKSTQAPLIAVDVRMAWHSGIGRYIREAIPRVRALMPDINWRWVGQAPEAWMRLEHPQTEFVEWLTPVYSWREHLSTPRALTDATVQWVPHYNVTPRSCNKLVVTIHDLLPLRYSGGWRGWLRAEIMRQYLRRIRRRANVVLANSEFTASELKKLGRISKERIRVTPLGVRADFGVAKETIENKRRWFLFVGNIKPHKNLITLLEAWSQIKERIPEELVIVGKMDSFLTPDRSIVKYANTQESRVKFTGHIDDEALTQYMRGATALVQPSLYEGFGLPVLEAMAVGCPVIATRAGALPEVGGEAALYFPPRDFRALASLLVQISQDESLREKMRAAGLARAGKFTWERTAMLTAAALREVLGT